MSDNGAGDVPRVTLGFLRSQEENRRFLVECLKNPHRNQSSNLSREPENGMAEERERGVWMG
jgi:hypothetical protein